MASLWSKIKEKAKSTYTKIDSKIGGVLPGGAPRSSGTTTSQQTGGGSSSSSSSSSGKTSSGGLSSSGGSSGGGMSRINPITKQAEYVLPSGMVVPVNEQTTSAIVSGKSDAQIVLISKSSGGSSKTGTLATQSTSSSGAPFSFLTNQSSLSNTFVNQNQSNKQSIAPTPQSSLSKKVESLKSTPLGTPSVEDDRGFFKKGVDYVSDKISGATGGVWLSHFGRETGMSAGDIKKEFKESTIEGAKKTIIFGIPGVAGLTAEGKVRTAWSKDKDKKLDATSGLSTIGNPLGSIQEEWGKSASEIRESGRTTKAQQESQIKSIEQISKDIDDLTKEYSGDFTSKDYIDIAFGKKDINLTAQDRIDLIFGKKTALDFDESKKQAPGVQAKEFEKEADSYLKNVESFNQKYGGKELKPEDYELAVKEKAKLDTERERLTAKQDYLTKAYESYETNVVSKLGDLRKVGVETTIDEKGNLAFKSKDLDTKVAPVGFKLQKDFMKDDKITWKNIAYGGGAVVHTTAEAVAVGFATGGTGVIAKIGAGVSKLPKIAQLGIKVGGVALAVGGVASKGYSGYQLAKQVEVPGWYGATLGTTIGIGQVGGFMAGGYLGTKVYYAGVQEKILAGKYTKSVAEMREGTLIIDKTGTTKGGLAKQLGIYETKVKGTDWTIKSGVKMTGQYGKDFGQSSVQMTSKFVGKAPKGVPKTWTTQGKTLESGDWVKLRAYTQSGKSKLWYEQDFLLKRTMIDKLKVDVSANPKFQGYTELERLKFLTSIKSVGQPVKVGKTLPKDVWKADEVFRFTNWKGKGKVVQPWEWGEAKADSTFGTKQFVLWKEAKPISTNVGNIKVSSTEYGVKGFQSLAKSQGMSTELLKQQLKDAVIVIKESNLGAPMNKRGQVSLTWQRPQVTTQVPKVTPKPTQVFKPTTMLDSKALLKLQLQQVVPGLISKQFVSQIPTTLALSSGIMGTSQILETKQSLAVLNQQKLMQRLQQVQLAKALQQQTPMQQAKQVQQVQQAQVTELALQTAVITPTMTTPPITATGIPIIPGMPMPDLYGWGWKEQKETLRGKNYGAYIPDFTAKALGLKPKTLSKAQLKKLLKTDLTGLGVRRGVIPA